MMVLHANGDRSFAVSFPRDLWVTIPGRGAMKINAAFNDGPQALVDTLQQNFGLAVNHYLELDFRSFEGLVDAVGTIPVWFDYTTKDENTGLLIPFAPACYQLNGAQSLAYVRARAGEGAGFLQYWIDGKWVSADAIPDFGRIERQQDFVKKLGRLVVERATDDPTIAPDLADKVIPNLEADSGFDRGAFNELARAVIGLSSGDGSSIEFGTLPADGGRRDGQDVLLAKQPAADEMLARLRGEVVAEPAPEAVDGAPAPVGVAPGDTRVTVLNGTGVNQAAQDRAERARHARLCPGRDRQQRPGHRAAHGSPSPCLRRGEGAARRLVRRGRRRPRARRQPDDRRRPRPRQELHRDPRRRPRRPTRPTPRLPRPKSSAGRPRSTRHAGFLSCTPCCGFPDRRCAPSRGAT